MKTSIQLLQGVEGIKSAYESLLNEANLNIVCLSKKYFEVVGDYFDKQYTPRLYGSNILTREILPDTKENRDEVKKKPTKNQVKFLKTNGSESDIILTQDSVTFITFDRICPYALIIHDLQIVKSLKSQFETLWQNL